MSIVMPRSEIAQFYGDSEGHVADLWNSIREKEGTGGNDGTTEEDS